LLTPNNIVSGSSASRRWRNSNLFVHHPEHKSKLRRVRDNALSLATAESRAPLAD
jgi:hypothetical protein